MKSLRISIIVTIVTIVFLCSGLVAALNSNEATVQTFFSSETLQAGQTVSITIFFTSSSADELQITNVGLHFDWMPTDGFLGYQLPIPVNISSGGGSHLFDQPITIQIPTNVTSGSHSYFVGIDGMQGASLSPFSWDSPSSTKDVVGGSVNPSPTSTNSGGEQPVDQPDLLLYGAIAAVVIIILLLIVVLVLRKKRKHPKSETTPPVSEPETPKPDEKPSSEQDFNI